MVFLKRELSTYQARRYVQTSTLNPIKSAWKITLIYAAVGLTWIFSSDWLVSLVWGRSDYLTIVNMAKGWAYVTFTSLLLFALIASTLGKAEEHKLELHASYETLKQLHNQLSESETLAKEQLKENLANQTRLHQLAYYDSLTGLPNRLSLQRDLQRAMESNHDHAVIFLDLDNFKDINDFRSHEVGDLLLQNVAKRLKASFPSPLEIYRFGGDEFIFLAPCPSLGEAEQVAQDILSCFQGPFQLNDSHLHLTPSLGLAWARGEECLFDDLIQQADLAMYHSKKQGGNSYSVFSPDLLEESNRRLLVEQQLLNMWHNKELKVYYQPEVSMTEQNILGFEALLRWEPADFIQASVSEVITIAESTGLILPIGEWLLREACLFLKKVHDLGLSTTTITVNSSIVQFGHQEFAKKVEQILWETQLKPEFLRLDITESVLMQSYSLIELQLENLRQLGVKVTLDDFGKGFSSLHTLKELPIDTLKIDKSLIDNVTMESTDALLAGHIIAMGHTLDLYVVAEGVESADQLQYLQEHNCQSYQGYLYSRPLPETEALALVEKELQRHASN